MLPSFRSDAKGDYKSAPSGRPHQPLCLTLCSNIAIVPTPLVTGWQVAGDGRIRTAQQLRERMVGCNTPTAWV
ncbi:BZ3500_MvSof-1268-A1-R1_Chr9g10466 [Microbotryum saponariae]|uniref:BZ3500_MvSof-1268-A1-R1_Chr9g10466 protein n=1 Tax=Microbotryum saponariae TaxID=289078 RepID=A0A2X0MED2_9BASI|nr:BZ3501_MvSof-1269-A2-R1_Chr9g10216 [Microbotryum saponariae]SDA00136.1 BZ3500_MvSof-1268-A1-R1_Chr9g10466 [Microbotryum saponariae]